MKEFRDDQATLLAHDDTYPYGAVVPPIYQTSLFTFDSYEAMEESFSGVATDVRPLYSRGNNPTVMTLESKVAELEGGEAARAFSSGMAAIAASTFSRLQAGDKLLCVKHAYPGTFRLFTQVLQRFGITVTFVDGRDANAILEQLPGAKVLYLESPTSLTFELQDLRTLAAAARAQGVFTILDNSWATPVFQQPLKHGIDMVVHSVSKFLGGHSDVVAGIVVGSEEAIARLNSVEYPLLGGKLAPIEAWLVLRGLRTLPLRMRHHYESAVSLAKQLQDHPLVEQVNHPLLQTHPQYALAQQYLKGSSGLFSVILRGDVSTVKCFVNSLKVFRLGVSWGGHESLVFPAALGQVEKGEGNSYQAFDVPKQLVRLYVGLESTAALGQDLIQALSQAEKSAVS